MSTFSKPIEPSSISLTSGYRKWIDAEAERMPKAPASRYVTGQELVNRARLAANRIESGIALLMVLENEQGELTIAYRGRPLRFTEIAVRTSRPAPPEIEGPLPLQGPSTPQSHNN